MTRRGSLTARILATAALNVLLLLAAAAVFARWQLRQEFEGFLMAGGGERVANVALSLGSDLQLRPASDRAAALDALSRQYGATFLLVLNDGARIAGQPVAIPAEVLQRLRGPAPPGRRGGPPDDPEGRGRAGGGGPGRGEPVFLVHAQQSPVYWIGARMPIPEPGLPPHPGTLLIATDNFFTNPFFFQLGPWASLMAATLLLSALCWLPWVRGVTRDIRQIELATAHVADGRFDVRLEVRRNDEIGRLAAAVGQMALRLDELVRSQKRFLGDAAHELRSPLTRMQVAVDLLERDTAPAMRQHVVDVREDIDEMGRLTEALLHLTRAELGAASQAPEDVRLEEAVARAVRFERGMADVRMDVPQDLMVRVTHDNLSRALRNVIRNAVFYAGDEGPIDVRACANGSEACIEVADQGPGLADKDLLRVFTPFYRSDTSRDRHSGGTGLGLAIVRAAIEASGGSVTCRNRSPHGLLVTMTLPLA